MTEEAKEYISRIVGRPINSVRDLTITELEGILNALPQLRKLVTDA